jgi:hypothetical protein
LPDDGDGEYKYWLEAQIALQREALKGIKDKDTRSAKQGQIALKLLKLKNVRSVRKVKKKR